MDNVLHLDFEVRSQVNLPEQGVYNYARHLSTKPLMLAYKFNKQPVKLHAFRDGGLPLELSEAFQNPDISLLAFNSTFERYILQYCLGIKLPASRFQDPQASARYLSLPASLDIVGEVLRLNKEHIKDEKGEKLIDLFCKPKTKKDSERVYFNDWNSHPEEWKTFCQYCMQDVLSEEEVSRRLELLGVFPLPEFERKIWLLDQDINDRGIPVDIKFVKNALNLAKRSKKEASDAQNEITGLKNANSPKQFLGWVQPRGYPFGTLRKDVVVKTLKDPDIILADECREVLKTRLEASSTTYTKLDAILQRVGEDGRLRNSFLYMGSSRCGRWSGSGVQLHNLARPGVVNNQNFEDIKVVDKARNLVYNLDYAGIQNEFGSVLQTIKNLIRTSFSGNSQLNIIDLASIETRVGSWVSECSSLMKVFEEGKDAYLDYANKITGIPYDKLYSDYISKDPELKSAAKNHRQQAKPAVLGAIYGLGGGGWGVNKHGDKVKTGLWAYAENMGIIMTQEKAHELVRVFRNAYPEIGGLPNRDVNFKGGIWYRLEEAAKDVLKEGTVNVIRELGPNNCIKIDKLIISGRGNVLRIQLPSGRYLHYMDARIESTKMPWVNDKGEEVFRPTLVYSGSHQITKQWVTNITSRGSKLFENIVQGIARDVLAYKMLKIQEL